MEKYDLINGQNAYFTGDFANTCANVDDYDYAVDIYASSGQVMAHNVDQSQNILSIFQNIL